MKTMYLLTEEERQTIIEHANELWNLAWNLESQHDREEVLERSNAIHDLVTQKE